MVKVCIICGKELTGRQRTLCSDKECHRERINEHNRKWRQNYPEKKKEIDRIYRLNNSEKIERYRQEHKDDRNDYDHKWRQDNPEKVKENNHKYRQNNQEKANNYSHEYYQSNREKTLDKNRRQYRRSRGLPEDVDLHKESSIEIIMREWLQNNSIEFEQEYHINLENSTWTRVDFYIPEKKYCLYCDGGYWHSSLEVQDRDRRISKVLKEMGYRVFRMTEAEILEGNKPWDLINKQREGVNING